MIASSKHFSKANHVLFSIVKIDISLPGMIQFYYKEYCSGDHQVYSLTENGTQKPKIDFLLH